MLRHIGPHNESLVEAVISAAIFVSGATGQMLAPAR